MNIWVVIPAYNEEKYLSRVLEKVKNFSKQVIVVDDGSSDRTVEISNSYGVITLEHEVNRGKGAALLTGCTYAFEAENADAVIIMDSDDQHDPGMIPIFEEKLASFDVALGARIERKAMPIMRKLGSVLTSRWVQLLTGTYISDIPSGYKAFNRKAYKILIWQSQGYDIEAEFAVRLAKSSLKYTEIPIETLYHDYDYGFTTWKAIGVFLRIPLWLFK